MVTALSVVASQSTSTAVYGVAPFTTCTCTSRVFRLCVTVSGDAVPVNAAANFFAMPVTAVLTYVCVAMTVVSTATVSAATVMPVPAPTSSTLPVSVRPFPAVYVPAPANCTQLRPVVPTVIGALVDMTHAVSAFVVPADTNTAAFRRSASLSASVARAHAVADAIQMPFSAGATN